MAGSLRFLSPSSYIIAAVLFGTAIYVIYVNAKYLKEKRVDSRLIKANRWFSVLQVFHIAAMGYAFYFIAGPEILPTFGYSDHIFFGVNVFLFNFSFQFGHFHNQTDISAGFNLVPLVYLFLFNRAVDKEREERQALLDSFMKREKKEVV